MEGCKGPLDRFPGRAHRPDTAPAEGFPRWCGFGKDDTMRYYVEAFHDDGRQALGMGSGQASFEAKYPLRTRAWKHVLRLCIVGDSWKGCTRWHLVDERRNVVAIAVQRPPVRTIDGPAR